MIRYYLLAALIVTVIGSIAFAHRLAPPNLRIVARPSGTPTVETRRTAEAPPTARPFRGEGAWVLSALPDCFDEQSRTSGPFAALAARIPPPGERIAPGTQLTVGGCSLTVRARDIVVDRGADRLRVPPQAALYRVRGHLVLTVRTGGRLEIRTY